MQANGISDHFVHPKSDKGNHRIDVGLFAAHSQGGSDDGRARFGDAEIEISIRVELLELLRVIETNIHNDEDYILIFLG